MASSGLLWWSLIFPIFGLSEVHSFTDGDLRLNGVGSSPLVGRLEVYFEGQWGSVCGGSANDYPSVNFNFGAAHVACRQMGLGFAVNFYSMHNLPQYRLQYGVSNGSIFMRDVNCQDDASENNLLQCLRFYDLGDAEGCDHSMDVVLQCSNITSPYNGEIRLVPDPSTAESQRTPSSGRLELYSEGLWKNVCLEDVTLDTASSLCQQMGYVDANTLKPVSGQELEEVWHIAGGPITCSSTDVCIGSCLDQLPVSVSTTSCQAIILSCNGATTYGTSMFGTRATCERNYVRTPEKSVRLVGSLDDPSVGRLEVYVGGVWGTVCQESFDIQDAEVVCKQLGFPYALAEDRVGTTPYFSYIQSANQSTRIHSVPQCRGVEKNLLECTIHNNHNCSASGHNKDVAVKCSWRAPYGSLALHGRVNGASGASGTLVMYSSVNLSPNFYPICDAGFEPQQATVACRQLGYSDGIVLHNSYFGSYGSSQDILLQLTGSCSGSESELLECPPAGSWDEVAERNGFVPVAINQSSECRPGYDEVALQCVSEEIQFRLTGSGRRDEGHLEINYGGTWGRICGSGFGISEALVACRHIGYPSVLDVQVLANSGSSASSPIHLSNLSCSGFERSMLHCHFSLATLTSSCSMSEDNIWLKCGSEPHPDEGELRLVGEEQVNGTGRLEISFNGEWHSLCGQSFSEVAAQVACRELGYSNLTSYCTDACFGRGSNEVLLVKEMCIGSEHSLKDCPRQQYHSTTCDHSYDIGLSCADPILEDTSSAVPTVPPSTGLQPVVPPKEFNLYYIIAAGAGGLVLLLVCCVCLCCVCCCWRRKKKNDEGRWDTHRSDITQNGHAAVGDMSKMAPIKEEGFDDPKEMLEEIDPISPHPFATYNRSISPPLPLRHHDVILHALSSSSQNSDEDQPSVTTDRRRAEQRAHLNQATTEFQHLEDSKLDGDMTVVVVGTEHRQPVLGHAHCNGSPVSFTCPPPNYDEIFQSSSAIPETNGYANGCHSKKSMDWYDSSVDSDSDEDIKKR